MQSTWDACPADSFSSASAWLVALKEPRPDPAINRRRLQLVSPIRHQHTNSGVRRPPNFDTHGPSFNSEYQEQPLVANRSPSPEYSLAYYYSDENEKSSIRSPSHELSPAYYSDEHEQSPSRSPSPEDSPANYSAPRALPLLCFIPVTGDVYPQNSFSSTAQCTD